MGRALKKRVSVCQAVRCAVLMREVWGRRAPRCTVDVWLWLRGVTLLTTPLFEFAASEERKVLQVFHTGISTSCFQRLHFLAVFRCGFFFFTPFLSHEAFCVRVLAGCIKIYLFFFMLQTVVVLLFLQTFKEADIFHHDCDLVDCNDGCFHRHHLTIEIIQLLSP